MENWLRNGVLPSIVGGLVVSSVEVLVRILRSHGVDWKRSIRIGTIAAGITLVVLTYAPPYSVSLTDWCLAPHGTTRGTGEVVRWLLRTPVTGATIQTKLFPADSPDALQLEEFGTTDWNGRFAAELRPPQPGRGMHLVNTAYNYDSLLWSDRWYINDFKKATLPAASSRRHSRADHGRHVQRSGSMDI